MADGAAGRNTPSDGPLIKSITVIGLGVFGYAIYDQISNPRLSVEWVLLSVVTVLVVSRLDIQIPKTSGTITISDTFIFTCFLLFGLFPAVILAGIDAAICSLHYRNRGKVLPFNAAVMSLSIGVSGFVVNQLLGVVDPKTVPAGRMMAVTFVMSAIHYGVNAGIVGLVHALRRSTQRMKSWKEYVLWSSVTYFGGAAGACLIVALIQAIQFYAFIVAVPILTCIYLTYRGYLDKVETSMNHAEQMAELHLRTIEALAIAIDAKDEVTHDHVRRVQIYATGLARLFGLSEPEIEALRAGALLHDIGKLAVPDYILNKPGPLTIAEFDRMKVHTIVGSEILERVGFPYPVVPVVRHHHERWDGRGYPDQLKGDQIPIAARILTVSDCFDAVREERPYRPAMTRDEAIALLREGAATAFDPEVVRVFLQNLPNFEMEIRRQQVELQVTGARSSRKAAARNLPADSGRMAFERIRSAHREVTALYEIAQTISTSLDLRDTFAVFSSRLEDIVSYTTCALYLRGANATDLVAAHVSGRNAERLRGQTLSMGSGIAGWVVANGHAMYNCEAKLDFEALNVTIEDHYTAATVVPLLRDGEVLGALGLYSVDLAAYESDDLRLVEAVAKLASDAIGNAVQHERSEANSLTDALTLLPNARALRHRFEEEADRATRHRDIFSVVMMDLDGFKAVNDRLGHQAGDALLKELAALLMTQIRSSDFVSRYAGDEFVAILQIGPDEVPELLHRIQAVVDNHDFGLGASNIFGGISVGWASFGVEGKTLDELLIGADRSMYADKSKRKATVAPAAPASKTERDAFRVM